MRINVTDNLVPDDILPQDGVWVWPEPGTWTGEDVFKFLDWMVSIQGIENLTMDTHQPAFTCINNCAKSFDHPTPSLDDCHAIVQALGGPDLRLNCHDFYEGSLRAVSRNGSTYRVSVGACHTAQNGTKGIQIVFMVRPQHTCWMGQTFIQS